MGRKKRNAPPDHEVKKVFSAKIIEALEALQLLRDAISKVKEGKWYYISVLSGQLPALLIDRTGGAERRLLYVAEALGMPFSVFFIELGDGSDFPLKEKPVFWASGLFITNERQMPAQVEISFEDLLNKPVIAFDGVRYTPRTPIEWFANKVGGAHYSNSLPRHFAEMLNFKIAELPILRQLLLQLAEATFRAGVKLLRTTSQYELHLLLAVPETPIQSICLLDAKYPSSPMRLSLFLDTSGVPFAYIVGLDGASLVLRCDRLVDWSEPLHLQLSMSLTDDLSTRADFSLDGINYGSVEIYAPLFLYGRSWHDFDVLYGRLLDGPPQDHLFGLSQVLFFSAQNSASDHAKMFLYMEQRRKDPNLNLLVYHPKSFSRAASGTNDMEIEGIVKPASAADFLKSAVHYKNSAGSQQE